MLGRLPLGLVVMLDLTLSTATSSMVSQCYSKRPTNEDSARKRPFPSVNLWGLSCSTLISTGLTRHSLYPETVQMFSQRTAARCPYRSTRIPPVTAQGFSIRRACAEMVDLQDLTWLLLISAPTPMWPRRWYQRHDSLMRTSRLSYNDVQMKAEENQRF